MSGRAGLKLKQIKKGVLQGVDEDSEIQNVS